MTEHLCISHHIRFPISQLQAFRTLQAANLLGYVLVKHDLKTQAHMHGAPPGC